MTKTGIVRIEMREGRWGSERVSRSLPGIALLLLVICLGCGTPAWAEEPDASEEVGQRLQLLEERAQSAEARLVRFRELRRFPFRSKPVELEGIARIDRSRGTSIAYPTKGSVIIVDQQGMLMRRLESSGVAKDRELPEAEGEAGKLMSALFQFDKAALAEQFNIETSGDEGRWRLLLTPKDGRSSKLENVEIESGPENIRFIDISLKGNRGFRIEPLEEQERAGFDDQELKLYFR